MNIRFGDPPVVIRIADEGELVTLDPTKLELLDPKEHTVTVRLGPNPDARLAGPGERIISNVTYCVRYGADWLVGLDCARECELVSPRNLHYAGVLQIEHECARKNERLVVPSFNEPCPPLLKTEPA